VDTFALVAILIFVAIALAIFGLLSASAYRRDRQRLVDKIRGSAQHSTLESESSAAGGRTAFTSWLVRHASAIGLKLGPAQEPGQPSPLGKLLQQGGFRRPRAMATFFGLKIISVALFTAAALLGRVFITPPPTPFQTMVGVVAITLFGWYLPDIALRLRVAHRKELILEGFPDALDLMVVCVEAGMGLDGALSRVGEEIEFRSPMVAAEFRSLSLELRGGKMRRDALRNLAMRTGLEEISAFVGLLVQTDRFGTSVAQALRVHTEAMRIRRAQRAEEMAAKLPVKLVFPLLFCIFPAIFVVVVGPAAIKVYRSVFMRLGQ